MQLLFIHVSTPDKSHPCLGTDKITNLQPARQKVTNQIMSVLAKMTVPISGTASGGRSGMPGLGPALPQKVQRAQIPGDT